MRAPNRWIAGVSAVVILLTTAAAAAGYTGQVEATATVAVRGTVSCDAPFTLTATFLDLDGVPVAETSVDWSFVTRPSPSDTINETPTMTNADGVARTTVSLAPVNGEREIRATAGEVSASTVVTAVCGGLPRTDTLPEETPAGVPPAAVLLLAFGCLAAGALVLRRLA